MGASQGTMNNLTFGDVPVSVLRNDLFRLALGAGLRRHGCGACAHDQFPRSPIRKSWKRAFPVVLEDFHIRKGSGGKGRWKAGDGHQPHPALPAKADVLRHPRLPPPRPALRCRWRRAGRWVGAHLRAAQGRADRRARRLPTRRRWRPARRITVITPHRGRLRQGVMWAQGWGRNV